MRSYGDSALVTGTPIQLSDRVSAYSLLLFYGRWTGRKWGSDSPPKLSPPLPPWQICHPGVGATCFQAAVQAGSFLASADVLTGADRLLGGTPVGRRWHMLGVRGEAVREIELSLAGPD